MTRGVMHRLAKVVRSGLCDFEKVGGACVKVGLVRGPIRLGFRRRDQDDPCSGVVARSIRSHALSMIATTDWEA
jgi:hypothetical protein